MALCHGPAVVAQIIVAIFACVPQVRRWCVELELHVVAFICGLDCDALVQRPMGCCNFSVGITG